MVGFPRSGHVIMINTDLLVVGFSKLANMAVTSYLEASKASASLSATSAGEAEGSGYPGQVAGSFGWPETGSRRGLNRSPFEATARPRRGHGEATARHASTRSAFILLFCS